jgi:hypothetical protein
MASDLISYLIQNKVAEWEQKEAEFVREQAGLRAALEQQQTDIKTAREATLQDAAMKVVQQAIEDVLIARFPDTPLTVMRDIRRITNPERLQALIGPLAGAATLEDARRLLADAAAANGA